MPCMFKPMHQGDAKSIVGWMDGWVDAFFGEIFLFLPGNKSAGEERERKKERKNRDRFKLWFRNYTATATAN